MEKGIHRARNGALEFGLLVELALHGAFTMSIHKTRRETARQIYG